MIVLVGSQPTFFYIDDRHSEWKQNIKHMDKWRKIDKNIKNLQLSIKLLKKNGYK